MNIMKKTFVASLFGLTALCFANTVSAATFWLTAVPTRVFASNSKWLDGFDLTGITSAGACPLDSNGLLQVSIAKPGTVGNIDPSGNRLFAVALAAELAGKPVTLRIDDNYVDVNGTCIAEWVYM